MHPALSIVFFTTASGAGFALLLLIGLGVPLGLLPADPWFGFAGLATAFVVSSTSALWPSPPSLLAARRMK